MATLKTYRPGPQAIRPALGAPDRGEAMRARDRMRAKLAARRLYQSKRWRDLRLAVLERDGWVCQATGVYLVQGARGDNAAVVDHITPHRGDLALFFDPTNCRAVCKAWHDSAKQRAEKAEASARVARGGWVNL